MFLLTNLNLKPPLFRLTLLHTPHVDSQSNVSKLLLFLFLNFNWQSFIIFVLKLRKKKDVSRIFSSPNAGRTDQGWI
jgi:hypothetical protein